MDKVYSRSEPRVLYRAPIWLRPSESGSSIVGETRNVSRRGMFVHVLPTPQLGTEVYCEIPGRPAVLGRVTWVFQGSTEDTRTLSGVGIEIVGAGETSSSLVEELVGMRLDDTQPLEIRFAGVNSSIRATGRVTHEGVDLSTILGFLRVGSDVTVGAAEDERTGKLAGHVSRVGMSTQDGVPRLQISIALEPERAPLDLDAEDERWFPEIVFEAPKSGPLPLIASETIDPEPTLRTIEAEAPASAEAIPQADIAHAETIAAEAVPEVAPAKSASRRVRPFWAPPKRDRRRGLLIALALVATGAGAVTVLAPQPPPVEEAQVEVTTVPTTQNAPVAPVVPVTAAPVADERPVAHVPVQAAEHPVEEVAVAPTPTPAAPPTSTDKAPATGEWKPQIVTTGPTPTIFVPLTGTKGMSTFTMSDPPGLAIDLPKGKTEVTMKSYLLHDDHLRSLWVRARPTGGVQVRLHVAPGTHLAATAVDGGVRFRVVEK